MIENFQQQKPSPLMNRSEKDQDISANTMYNITAFALFWIVDRKEKETARTKSNERRKELKIGVTKEEI